VEERIRGAIKNNEPTGWYAKLDEETQREGVYQETWIQNQVDEVAQLVAETCYLLTLV
jgi:hypothetical protein